MNKKFLLSVSLLTFCASALSYDLEAAASGATDIYLTPLTSLEGFNGAHLKSFDLIKQSVTNELLKELLKKLALLNTQQTRKKKAHDIIKGAKEISTAGLKADKSAQKLLDVTPSSSSFEAGEEYPVLSSPLLSEGSKPSAKAISSEEDALTSTTGASVKSEGLMTSDLPPQLGISHQASSFDPNMTPSSSTQNPIRIIDLDGLNIHKDPNGNFYSINDKIILTKKGLTRLKRQFEIQQKIISDLKSKVDILGTEFASNNMSEEAYLTAQISLNQAISVLESMKLSIKEQEHAIAEHRDMIALLDRLPAHHTSAPKSKKTQTGLAQEFLNKFDALYHPLISTQSVHVKEQKAVQAALEQYFGVTLHSSSPAIVAIQKLHHELLKGNQHQTLEQTAYSAGKTLISEMLDSLGQDKEVQEALYSVLPHPKKYANKNKMIDDYQKRLSHFKHIFGDDSLQMIQNHFKDITQMGSSEAASSYAFIIKFLDLTLRLNKGIHGPNGLRAFVKPQAYEDEQNKLLAEVAHPMRPLQALFPRNDILNDLIQVFHGQRLIDLSTEEALQKIKALVLQRVVGANKQEMLDNLAHLYNPSMGSLNKVRQDVALAFHGINDDPVALIGALEDHLENEDSLDLLSPLQMIFIDATAPLTRLFSREGHNSAGIKLLKNLQDNYLETYGSKNPQSIQSRVLDAVDTLIKSEFKKISLRNQAYATPVDTLANTLFFDGLFSGITLNNAERKEIKDHIARLITIQKLGHTMNVQELKRKENAIITPLYESIAKKVAFLVTHHAFDDQKFDLGDVVTAGVSTKNSAQDLRHQLDEIADALTETLDDALNHLHGRSLGTLSKEELSEVIENCVHHAERTRHLSNTAQSDLTQLLMTRIQTVRDSLSNAKPTKTPLSKSKIALNPNSRATLIDLLGENDLQQKNALDLLSPEQKLWVYNTLVALGEEEVTYTDAIEKRLHNIIDAGDNLLANPAIDLTFDDLSERALALKDDLGLDLALTAFDLKLASSLLWQARDHRLEIKQAKAHRKAELEESNNQKAIKTLQNLLPRMTHEMREELGIHDYDDQEDLQHALDGEIHRLTDLKQQTKADLEVRMERSKTAKLGAVQDPIPTTKLRKPSSKAEKIAKKLHEKLIDRMCDAVDDAHWDNAVTRGIMLLLSKKFNITSIEDFERSKPAIEESAKKIRAGLTAQFHQELGSATEKEAIDHVYATLAPFTDAMSEQNIRALKTYAHILYNKMQREFFKTITTGKAFDFDTAINTIERNIFGEHSELLIEKTYGLSLKTFESDIAQSLTDTLHLKRDVLKITNQVKRMVVGYSALNLKPPSLMDVINGAIAQCFDAPHRVIIKKAALNRDSAQEDFSEIIRRSSRTLEKLMFTRLLGLDERTLVHGDYRTCFTSLEGVNPSLLLSGLINLIDELPQEDLKDIRDSDEKRYKTKKALIKRFAKVEEKLLAHQSIHQLLEKDSIPLKPDFKSSLTKALGNDHAQQLRAVSLMQPNQLQELYNSLVADKDDQVAYVKSDVVAHRLLRIIDAAHNASSARGIDYTFHDFMDYFMYAVDSDDLDLSEPSGNGKKDSILDLDRLVIGRLSWERKIKDKDQEKKSDFIKLHELEKEALSDEIKEQLIRKGAQREAYDYKD